MSNNIKFWWGTKTVRFIRHNLFRLFNLRFSLFAFELNDDKICIILFVFWEIRILTQCVVEEVGVFVRCKPHCGVWNCSAIPASSVDWFRISYVHHLYRLCICARRSDTKVIVFYYAGLRVRTELKQTSNAGWNVDSTRSFIASAVCLSPHVPRQPACLYATRPCIISVGGIWRLCKLEISPGIFNWRRGLFSMCTRTLSLLSFSLCLTSSWETRACSCQICYEIPEPETLMYTLALKWIHHPEDSISSLSPAATNPRGYCFCRSDMDILFHFALKDTSADVE